MNYLEKILNVIDWIMLGLGAMGFFGLLGSIGAIDYSVERGVHPYSGSWVCFLVSFVMVLIVTVYMAVRSKEK